MLCSRTGAMAGVASDAKAADMVRSAPGARVCAMAGVAGDAKAGAVRYVGASLRGARTNESNRAWRSSAASAETSPYRATPTGSRSIRCGRASGEWAASQADSPRSSDTTVPSRPEIRASTRRAGRPSSMSLAMWRAATYSAIWRWTGSARPSWAWRNRRDETA